MAALTLAAMSGGMAVILCTVFACSVPLVITSASSLPSMTALQPGIKSPHRSTSPSQDLPPPMPTDRCSACRLRRHEPLAWRPRQGNKCRRSPARCQERILEVGTPVARFTALEKQRRRHFVHGENDSLTRLVGNRRRTRMHASQGIGHEPPAVTPFLGDP